MRLPNRAARKVEPGSLAAQITPAKAISRQVRRAHLLPLILLLSSIYTTLGSGALFMHNFRQGMQPLSTPDDLFPILWAWRHPHLLLAWGWPFSLSLLAILLAHEAGHYFFCRKFGIRATLPYVLPAPTIAGTAGAVIRIQSRIPDREALLEVGVAGPIAGYLVAVPVAIAGILLSHAAGPATPAPLIAMGQPLTISLLERLFSPTALAAPGGLVYHPVLMASWIGFFVTSLNLIPAGQLDGGHILYAISPQCHRLASKIVPVILLVLGVMYWTGWLLWGAILLLPAMRHPWVPNFPQLRRRHYWLGLAAIAMLVLTMLPSPFHGAGLISLIR